MLVSNSFLRKNNLKKILFGLFLSMLTFLFFSCNLTSSGKTTQTVTFLSLYDSIKTDDSAIIVFKTEDKKVLDTVFNGRIINKAGFANLPVDNWDGGLVVIYLTVYKDNKIVFQYERHVDGKTNKTTATFVIVPYNSGVDTTKVKPIDTTKVTPPDTTKVKPPDTTTQAHADGISVSPRTLKLYTGGEVLFLTVKVLPTTISQKVKWFSTNTTIAKVDDSGKVTPVAPGNVKVYATSLADSTKKDSADVTVKRDAPQVSVGQDTVVSLGKNVDFLPVVAPQEYGLVTMFKWDLNGDGAWDDSSAAVKLVSFKYDQDKEYLVRFYVRDTEGNETIVTKKVKTSQGPIVLIKSPLNNSYSNKRTVVIVWSINDAIQDSLNTQVLKDSVNTITRTAYDAAKNPFSNSITVYFDSIPPNKPVVHGNGLTSSLTPSWSWTSGGAGGNGNYRWAMDLEVTTSSPEIKDTLYTPTVPLTEGVHTLYVQERDNAGNWSASGTLAIKIDKTSPAKPVVKVTEGGLTNVVKPTFTWTSGGGGNGNFQWKLDNQDLSFGATTTTDLTYLSTLALASGQHTMYVREKDSTGNWSDLGSAQVTVDSRSPELDFVAPLANSGTYTETINPGVLIKVSAVDSGTGVQKVECSQGNAQPVQLNDIGNGFWSGTINFVSGLTKVTCSVYDKTNNSSSAFVNVNLVVPKPTITITSQDFRENMVLSKSLFTVKFDVQVGTNIFYESQLVDLGAVDGTVKVQLKSSAKNVLGEIGTKDILYHLLTKVIFVDLNATSTIHDGRSWATAYLNFNDAMNDSRINLADQQVWVSKGEYIGLAKSGYFVDSESIDLPSTAKILGGFDAVNLPSDSTSAYRSKANRSILTDYMLYIRNLGSAFEFNTLEFNNTLLKTVSTTPGGNFYLTRCTLLGMKQDNSSWTFSTTSNGFNTYFDEVNVTNQITPPGFSGWLLYLLTPHQNFIAKNSKFLRENPNAYSNAFLYQQNEVGTGLIQFENCEMAYKTPTGYRNFIVQNGNTSVKLIGDPTKIKGGRSSISVYGAAATSVNSFFGL